LRLAYWNADGVRGRKLELEQCAGDHGVDVCLLNETHLADNLEVQFQPVDDPSDPAIIDVVNEVMRAFEFAPASEPKLNSPSEVLQPIRGLNVGKAPGPTGIPSGS
jgi:hypothetical protein